MTRVNSDLHPDNGARVLLERLTETGEEARYAVTLYLPEQKLVGTARVMRGGQSELEVSGDPPEWARKITLAFLRQAGIHRGAGGVPSWPRRLMRWRPER